MYVSLSSLGDRLFSMPNRRRLLNSALLHLLGIYGGGGKLPPSANIHYLFRAQRARVISAVRREKCCFLILFLHLGLHG